MDHSQLRDIASAELLQGSSRIQHLLQMTEAHGVTADASPEARFELAVRAARLAEPASLGSVLDEAEARWALGSDVVRLAAGVRLLEDALRAVPGTDARLNAARAALWTAAFGHDLHATLARRPLLASTPIRLLVEPGPTRTALLAALACAQPSRDKDTTFRPGPVVSLHASGTDPTEHLDLLLGIDKSASPSGNTRRGVLEAAADGVAVIRDVGALSSAALAALESVLDEGRFRRRGDSRDRVLCARVVFVGSALRPGDDDGGSEPDLVSRALVVAVPPLQERPDDVQAVALAGLGDTAAGAALDADVLRRVAMLAAPGHAERAVVAEARAMVLLGKPTPSASHTLQAAAGAAPGTTEPPEVALPDNVRFGTASFDEVKAWYARHVRSLCRHDVEAAERLGIHRATLAKYLRGGDDA